MRFTTRFTIGATGVLAGIAALAVAVPGAATATGPTSTGASQPASQTASQTASDAPPLTVTTDRLSGAHGHRGGDIFVAPYGDSDTYASGAEILSPDGGKVVWFHPAEEGKQIADFRTQTYRGKPVLTFWQGTGLGGLATGTDYIYDDHYRKIAEVHAGNGYSADGHEFLITPQDTALILSYTRSTADLTDIGGPANQAVINGVVQEIDIRTGKVLFEWNSADHVPYAESEQPLPSSADTPWDWFHVNAVKLDTDGNLLVDARDTWTTYKIQRHTGRILWKLGGKDSSFALKAADGQVLNDDGKIFAWQHDAESHGHGVYTVFDNEAAGSGNTGTGVSSELSYSRAVTVRLDTRRHTATLVDADDQPNGDLASSQGNTQLLPNGHLFTGWGSLPELSETDRSGRVVFDATYPDGLISYRAYRLPWRSAS